MGSYLYKKETANHWSVEEIGTKAFNLKMMQDEGFPVPEFIVIPASYIDQLILKSRSEMASLCRGLEGLETQQMNRIVEVAEKIKSLLIKNLETAFLRKRFYEVFELNAKNDVSFAVRSSAIGEDGVTTSFAGQHHTSLFVSLDDVWKEIVRCICSAWNPNALIYRIQHGIFLKDIRIAVIIQHMVNASKSGVAFSMNINANLDDLIIIAGYGVGEGIVTDAVMTDQYIINRRHKIVKTKLAKKINLLNYDVNHGLKLSSVDKYLQNISCLSKHEIKDITQYSLSAERYMKMPSDIEFSIDSHGHLYILQMRPITTISYNDIKILDNTNIVESYPGITLPLSYSFARDAYKKVFLGSAKAFLVPAHLISRNRGLFEQLIDHPYGRIYYRLDHWYRMLSLITSSRKSLKDWENAVGLQTDKNHLLTISYTSKIRSLLAISILLLRSGTLSSRFFKAYKKNILLLKRCVPSSRNKKELWHNYELATQKLFKPWYLTIVNDFLAFKSFSWLQYLVHSYNISNENEFANNLLCGLGDIESEKAVLSTLALKKMINENKKYASLFEYSKEEICLFLKKKKYEQLSESIDLHLELFGDRNLAELKLETPSLRDKPELFIGLLKNLLLTNTTGETFLSSQIEIRQQAEFQVHRKLSWYNPKRLIFSIVRKLAVRGLQNRENMRFARTRAYGVVKQVFLKIGQLLKDENKITDLSDVFYLSMDELKHFCLDQDTEVKKNKIAKLKKEYRDYQDIKLPDRIIYQHDQIPIFRESNDENDIPTDDMSGIGVSAGIIEGEAIVVHHPSWDMDVSNKILITKMTDPGWVFLMIQAVGLISEKGSLLSHTAIVGRELSLPVIVGVDRIMQRVKSGDRIRMDGQKGIVEIVQIKEN